MDLKKIGNYNLQNITATVRTTSRMNALLSESLLSKRKAMVKTATNEEEEEEEVENAKPKNNWNFFHTNFCMEQVHKLIETTIEERLTWDRFSRSYDSWRALQLTENLAAEIRDRVRKCNYKRYRIVCLLSLIEKQNQGATMSMRHSMDEKMDNFTSLIYERPTYFIIAIVYLVHKD
ncbi:dynein light chain Tctex-type protein 2B isoform 1-T1 [Glossina fuscipes fuscipes]